MSLRQHAPLILALGVPVLMILFLAAAIYIPPLFMHPKYDFLYSTGSSYDGPYYVSDGMVSESTTTVPRPPYYPEPRLYLYDIAKDVSREISFADARRLRLDSSSVSPDGYEVVYGSRGDGFFPFFWGGTDYNTRYLKGSAGSKKLNLQTGNGGYYDFRFLGWITNAY